MTRRQHFFLAGALALVMPCTAAAQTPPQRVSPPPPGPLRPYRLPAISDQRLSNGLRLVVIERHNLPIVTARIMLDAGSVYEPAPKQGLASLTGSLLVEGGTKELTGAELAQRVEKLGAQINSSASISLSSVTLTSLPQDFATVLGLAAKTIVEPRFDPREFERVRGQAIAFYEQGRSTVEGLATEAFGRAIYDSVSPYARSPQGTGTTLRAITRDDVVAWHGTMYSPATTTLLVVGAVRAADARSIAEAAFAGWNTPAPSLPAFRNTPQPVPSTRVILIDRPGSVQSAIRVGQFGFAADDPDFFTLTVLDRVLGGGFNARMNMTLREKLGYTYGAFTNLQAFRGAGTFFVTSSVRTNVTDSALARAVQEYRRIVDEPVGEDELKGMINNLVASFPNSVQTVQGLAQRMQTVLIYNLPLDYYATYREKLAAVTSADIARVAKARLVPNALTIVVAGDLSKIEAPIRAMNLGAVEVWDQDGKRIK